MTWAESGPALATQAALWFLPGLAVLRALGLRRSLLWGGAPAVSAAVVGTVGILAPLVGLSWGIPALVVGTAVAAALAFALSRLLCGAGRGVVVPPARQAAEAHREGRGSTSVGGATARRTFSACLAVSFVVGAWLAARGLTRGLGSPEQPVQTWDTVFHLNAVAVVRETGRSSMLGGLAPMFEGTERYYPSVWHALTALSPGSVNAAANVSIVVLGSLVWLAGLLALTRTAWPERREPAVLVPLFGAASIAFPSVAMSVLGVWPFGASVACTPGALALLLAATRATGAPERRRRSAWGAVAASGGVVALHGSALFSLLLLGGPLVLAAAVRWGRRAWADGRRRRVLAVALGVPALAALGLVWVFAQPVTQAVVGYERVTNATYGQVLGDLLLDHPLNGGGATGGAGLVVTGFGLAGGVLAVRRRRERWLIVAAGLAGVLTLLAAGPDDAPLRSLTAVWFSQGARLHQLVTVPMLVLAADGAGALAGVLGRDGMPRRLLGLSLVAGTLLSATAGLRWSTRADVVAQVTTDQPVLYGTQLEPEELAMIDRAARTLPPGARVLGDPAVGTPFLLHRAGVDVVHPQLALDASSPARRVLEQSFRSWAEDPRVCAAVRELGVTHVYADTLTRGESGKLGEPVPGLRMLRPVEGEGFSRLDQGGHASIWEFTGCGQADPD